ncbi:hypothetical protein NL676_018028 [Syzygium grande]|nr:hypothetical protein NL676_018028 [Syzygium grande]
MALVSEAKAGARVRHQCEGDGPCSSEAVDLARGRQWTLLVGSGGPRSLEVESASATECKERNAHLEIGWGA